MVNYFKSKDWLAVILGLKDLNTAHLLPNNDTDQLNVLMTFDTSFGVMWSPVATAKLHSTLLSYELWRLPLAALKFYHATLC